MPDKPKNPPETDPGQSERFRQAVRDLEAAGELNPIEAERALARILAANPPKGSSDRSSE